MTMTITTTIFSWLFMSNHWEAGVEAMFIRLLLKHDSFLWGCDSSDVEHRVWGYDRPLPILLMSPDDEHDAGALICPHPLPSSSPSSFHSHSSQLSNRWFHSWSLFCFLFLFPTYHDPHPDVSFTSGIPVMGNLTLVATIEPAKPIGRMLDTYPAIEHTMKLVSIKPHHHVISSLSFFSGGRKANRMFLW